MAIVTLTTFSWKPKRELEVRPAQAGESDEGLTAGRG